MEPDMVKKEQEKLLQLAKKLPVHDSKIPIIETEKQEVIDVEAQIAGITKGIHISSMAGEIAHKSANGERDAAHKQIIEMAKIVGSFDSNQLPSNTKFTDKINRLDISDGFKSALQPLAAHFEQGKTADRLPAETVSQLEQDMMQVVAAEKDQHPQLADVLNSKALDDGKSVNEYLQSEKLYEVTDKGQLLNASAVRMGRAENMEWRHIVDIKKTFYENSNDKARQKKTMENFIDNLVKNGGKEELLGKDNKVRIAEVGPGDGDITAHFLDTLTEKFGLKKDDIIYTAIEQDKRFNDPKSEDAAQNVLKKAGYNNVTMIDGQFGREDNREVNAQIEQHYGKNNIVLAHHLYNFGKTMDKATEQFDGLMAENAVAITVHEKSGDALKWRQQFPDTFRLGGKSRTEDIADKYNDAADKRNWSKFETTSQAKVPKLREEEWKILENIRPGTHSTDYSKKAPEERQEVMKTAIQEYEFFGNIPATSMRPENKAKTFPAFREMVEKNGYSLQSVSEVQTLLSRGHSRELAEAVEKSSRQTEKQMQQEEKMEREVDKIRDGLEILFSGSHEQSASQDQQENNFQDKIRNGNNDNSRTNPAKDTFRRGG